MAQDHCILDTLGYKHALRIRNTYWFSTATLFARTLFDVTQNVHRLSCYKVNVNVLSKCLIKNKILSTSRCHCFESIHSLCCCARLSFASKF